MIGYFCGEYLDFFSTGYLTWLAIMGWTVDCLIGGLI